MFRYSYLIMGFIFAMPAFLTSCGEQAVEVTGPTYMNEPIINIMSAKIKIEKPELSQNKAEIVRMIGMEPYEYITQWVEEKCKPIGSSGTTTFKILQAQIYEKGDNEYHGRVRVKISFDKQNGSSKEIDVFVKAMQQFPPYAAYQTKINALHDLINELVNSAHEYTRQEIYKKGVKKDTDYYFG